MATNKPIDYSKHEQMETDGVCPRCGQTGLHRESVDCGFGLIFGPYGCPCGWSEDPGYDMLFNGGEQPDGSYADVYGMVTPARARRRTGGRNGDE